MELSNRTDVVKSQAAEAIKLYRDLASVKQARLYPVLVDTDPVTLDQTIDYNAIRYFVERVFDNRLILTSQTHQQKTLISFVTQQCCELIYNYDDITPMMVITFLMAVEDLDTQPMVPYQYLEIEHLIEHLFILHPKFYQIYRRLDPVFAGSNQCGAQLGPLEFLLCFYDCQSRLGIQNDVGFDIILQDTRLELKSVDSQKTGGWDKLQQIAADPRTDGLMLVKRADPSVKCYDTTLGSRYFFIPFNDDREQARFLTTGQIEKRVQRLAQYVTYVGERLTLKQLVEK